MKGARLDFARTQPFVEDGRARADAAGFVGHKSDVQARHAFGRDRRIFQADEFAALFLGKTGLELDVTARDNRAQARDAGGTAIARPHHPDLGVLGQEIGRFARHLHRDDDAFQVFR